MVADAEVARVDFDVLRVAGGLVQAGPPGDDAVQARVDRGGWDGQWPEAGLQRQLDRFGVPFLELLVRAPGVAVRVILEPDRAGEGDPGAYGVGIPPPELPGEDAAEAPADHAHRSVVAGAELV